MPKAHKRPHSAPHSDIHLKSGSRIDEVTLDSVNNPHCPHGPTARFKEAKGREYFACAAYRDRKACPFFVSLDEPKRKRADLLSDDQEVTHEERHSGWESIAHKPSATICLTCASLASSSCSSGGHDTKSGLSGEELTQPISKLLFRHSKTANKREAQFYFDQTTVGRLLALLEASQVSKVLCIGTPVLHERILIDKKMESFLLDIDERFELFYPPSQFSRYNMFNGHFFRGEDDSLKHLKTFLQGSDSMKIAVVIDPPFGGMLGLLLQSTHDLLTSKLSNGTLLQPACLLASPYFTEDKIKSSPIKQLTPWDVPLTYANHAKFNVAHRSPVRLFTNLQLNASKLKKIPSLASDAFKWCPDCAAGSGRLVAGWQTHCAKCGDCPGRGGGKEAVKFRHCDPCKRCFKAGSFRHCKQCDRCVPTAVKHSH